MPMSSFTPSSFRPACREPRRVGSECASRLDARASGDDLDNPVAGRRGLLDQRRPWPRLQRAWVLDWPADPGSWCASPPSRLTRSQYAAPAEATELLLGEPRARAEDHIRPRRLSTSEPTVASANGLAGGGTATTGSSGVTRWRQRLAASCPRPCRCGPSARP